MAQGEAEPLTVSDPAPADTAPESDGSGDGAAAKPSAATDLERLAQDERIRALRDALTRAVAQRGESKIHTLSDALFNLIERGFWRPGDKLPGEKELSLVLELSLGTVQAALRELVSAQLLERRRGAGTFVADAKELGSSIWHFRFRTLDGKNLLPWGSKVLSIDEVDDQGPWSEFLGFAPTYIRVRRINDLGEFKVYSEMHLDGSRFRPLLDVPLDLLAQKNIRVFLHERYNAPTFRGVHRVLSTTIEAEVAPLIEVQPGSHGLLIKALGFTFRDAPISYQTIVVPDTPHELEILG
jgi:GntR family transcriptional regulator